jgi:hypothetical protein
VATASSGSTAPVDVVPGVGDDADRQQAAGTVAGDRVPQRLRVEPALAVDGHQLKPHAECVRRLGYREVRLD